MTVLERRLHRLGEPAADLDAGETALRAGVTVLLGLTNGDNAVVSVASAVTEHVPEDSVVVRRGLTRTKRRCLST